MRKVQLGVIGAGVISDIYLKNCTGIFDHAVTVQAIADIIPEFAQKQAEKYNVLRACTVDELLADDEIEVVLNLTSPAAHAPVNLRALQSGKHVYTEKPFALSQSDANEVLTEANDRGLLVGCAPDTFLGAGIQTCIKLIDDGWIGQPYAAGGTIVMGNSADGMHPNFRNFLKLGGDPLLDMGPYYLTALIAMFGSVRRVTGSTQQLHREVTVRNPNSPAYGQTVPVEAPTNVAAVLDFENGVVATLQATKESFGYAPRFEVYGTEGNLVVPDPNFFSGAIYIKSRNHEMKEVPLTHSFVDNSRGLGVADMAYAIRTGRPHRASGRLARHVLDVSLGVFESSRSGRHVEVESTVERPLPLPMGLSHNALDE